MRVIFDTKTGLLTLDDRTIKFVAHKGEYSIEGLNGDEENSSLAGMVAVKLHDTLRDVQQAERMANQDKQYDNDPWQGNLCNDTLDKIYERLM